MISHAANTDAVVSEIVAATIAATVVATAVLIGCRNVARYRVMPWLHVKYNYFKTILGFIDVRQK